MKSFFIKLGGIRLKNTGDKLLVRTRDDKYYADITVKSIIADDVSINGASLLTGNAPITGATKTKITYDTKGLVTAGADATTEDIADSTNKRYCTDAQKTIIDNTNGVNTGDQTLNGLGGVPTTRQINAKALSTDITLTTADIADSSDRRYCTDAQKTVIGNTSGTNTGDQDLSLITVATKLYLYNNFI